MQEMLHCMASTPSSSEFTVLERQRAWLKWQQQQECYFYSADHALQSVPELDGLNDGWPNLSTSGSQILSNDPAPLVKDEAPTPPLERASSGGRSASKKRKADKSTSSILDGNAAEECIKEKKTKASVEENKTAAAKTDYIHVRARRGQATDSHSLAERVRREKISERMRYLQDLVPGCNKITSKAGMLDEIINYVQSLQRQVEFLSMKLSAVNPTLDFSVDNLFGKGINAMTPSMMIPETGMASELIDPSGFQLNTYVPGSMSQTFLDSCFNIYGGSDTSFLSDLELLQGKRSALLFQLLQGNFLPNQHIKMEM